MAVELQYVCGECFGEEGVANFCTAHAISDHCDFCGQTAEEEIAADIDEVVEHIRTCVYQHYADPDNVGMSYESAEGGYLGITLDTGDVLADLGLDFNDDRLRQAVEDALGNHLWCQLDPYGYTAEERLRFSWDEFCEVVKHKRRYFFGHEDADSDALSHDDLYSPGDTLSMILKFASDEGAFVPMKPGTRVYRARREKRGEKFRTAGELGPPPVEYATQTNRMSPPGIVMTYVSEYPDVALAETVDKSGRFALGTFEIGRELLLLDLTQLPPVPSPFAEIWDTLEYDPRPRLQFLHSVNRDISKPIARDDRAHISYVPTQIVTEYVRAVFKVNGQRADGIRYNSSRLPKASALVLFADQSNLIFDKGERSEFYSEKNRWLRLLEVKERRITKKNMVDWKHGSDEGTGIS